MEPQGRFTLEVQEHVENVAPETQRLHRKEVEKSWYEGFWTGMVTLGVIELVLFIFAFASEMARKVK